MLFSHPQNVLLWSLHPNKFEPRLRISAKISPPPESLPSPSDSVTVVDWSRVWELESLGLELYPQLPLTSYDLWANDFTSLCFNVPF